MTPPSDNPARGTADAFVIPAPPVVALPVVNSDGRFPVRRVFCVGRNYAAHAVEMGHDPDKEPPFFFEKAPGNLVLDGVVPYPPLTKDLHHEIELVVALQGEGADIPVGAAHRQVYGYAVGIDLTRRDLQADAKDKGRPWTSAKAFDHSAPCGPLMPAAEIGHPATGEIWLDVNGERRQTGDLAQLIWKVPEIIAHLSQLFVLAPGDLIFTGTPSGVGAVTRGDRLAGGIGGIGEIHVAVR